MVRPSAMAILTLPVGLKITSCRCCFLWFPSSDESDESDKADGSDESDQKDPSDSPDPSDQSDLTDLTDLSDLSEFDDSVLQPLVLALQYFLGKLVRRHVVVPEHLTEQHVHLPA